MAFPKVIGTPAASGVSTATTIHPVALPSGIVPGELLVCFYSAAQSGNGSFAFPGGWYVFATGQDLFVAYRIADGTEGSSMTVLIEAGGRSSHVVYRVSGASRSQMPEGGLPMPVGYRGLTVAENYQSVSTLAEKNMTGVTETPGAFKLPSSVDWSATTMAVHPSGAGGDAHPVVADRNAGQTGLTPTSTHPMKMPTKVVAGQMLIATFCRNGTTDDGTVPSGWTEIQSLANGTTRQYIMWRKADGTEGGTTHDFLTTATVRGSHCVLTIDGATDPTVTPPEVSTGATGTSAAPASDVINLGASKAYLILSILSHGGTDIYVQDDAQGNDTAPNPPSLTPTGGSKDYLFFAAAHYHQDADASTAPASYSNLQTASEYEAAIGVAERELAAASDDPGVFAWSGGADAWTTLTVAIHPALATVPGITHIKPAPWAVDRALADPSFANEQKGLIGTVPFWDGSGPPKELFTGDSDEEPDSWGPGVVGISPFVTTEGGQFAVSSDELFQLYDDSESWAIFLHYNKTGTDGSAYDGYVACRDSGLPAGMWGLYKENSHLKFIIGDGGESYKVLTFGTNVDPGLGVHSLAVTRMPGGVYTLYIDGIFAAEVTDTTAIAQGGATDLTFFGIGSSYATYTQYGTPHIFHMWKGSIPSADGLARLHAKPFGLITKARRLPITVPLVPPAVGDALLKLIAETTSISDARNSVTGIIKAIALTVASSTAALVVMALTRVHDATVSISEVLVRLRAMVRARDETVSVSETTLRPMALTRVRDAVVSVSETTLRLMSMVRAFASTVSITDARVKLVTAAGAALLKIRNSTVSISEAKLGVLGLVRSFASTVAVSEAKNSVMGIVRLFTDTVNVIEAEVRVRALVRAMDNVVNLTTVSARARALARSRASTVAVTESPLKARTMVRVAADTVNGVEAALGVLGLIRLYASTVSISEARNSVMGIVRRAADAVSISEATGSVTGIVRAIAETISTSEALVRLRALARILTEVVAVTTSPTKARTMVRLIAETERVQEAVLPARTLLRIISETIQGISGSVRLLPVVGMLTMARLVVMPAVFGALGVAASVRVTQLNNKPSIDGDLKVEK